MAFVVQPCAHDALRSGHRHVLTWRRRPGSRPATATASARRAHPRPRQPLLARSGALPGDPHARKYPVTVHNYRGDQKLSVEVPEDRFIWWYLEEQGHVLPHLCISGCCTTCAAKVISGQLEQPDALGLTTDLQREGYCLLCVSYPRSELHLQLQDEDEVYLKQWGSSFEGGGVEWGGVMPEDD